MYSYTVHQTETASVYPPTARSAAHQARLGGGGGASRRGAAPTPLDRAKAPRLEAEPLYAPTLGHISASPACTRCTCRLSPTGPHRRSISTRKTCTGEETPSDGPAPCASLTMSGREAVTKPQRRPGETHLTKGGGGRGGGLAPPLRITGRGPRRGVRGGAHFEKVSQRTTRPSVSTDRKEGGSPARSVPGSAAPASSAARGS